jgi:TonB-dependent SusC/RagA subfamily outer membrane receptor
MTKLMAVAFLVTLGFANSAQAQERMMPVQKAAVQIKSTRDPAKNKPYVIIVIGEKNYPVPADSVNSIDPETIKSINVLKDESATSLYGEKAKNGVVQIQLKAEAEKAFLERIKNNVGKQIKLRGPMLTNELLGK